MQHNEEKKYLIMQTLCFPNAWKVVSAIGRPNNAHYLFHPTLEKAKEQVVNDFHGEVLEIVRLPLQNIVKL